MYDKQNFTHDYGELLYSDENVKKTVEDVSSGATTWLNLIEGLKDGLVSENAAKRYNAEKFLALVVENMPRESLTSREVALISQFFLSKLDPESSANAMINSVSVQKSLLDFNGYNGTTAWDIIKGLCDIDIIALPQNVRFAIISLMENILDIYRLRFPKEAMVEFPNRFLKCASGEKDPRNLMVIFSIVNVILREFEFSDGSIDLDILENLLLVYFPVTFRPPPNNSLGITADDLKKRLRECIAARASFALVSIPMILEKMSLATLSVKQDILLTLIECISSYGWRSMSSFYLQIWDVLKFEILQPSDDEIKTLSENVLGTIAKTSPSTNGSFKKLIDAILDECKTNFGQPSSKLASTSGDLLFSVLSNNSGCLPFIFPEIAPMLLESFEKTLDISDKASILRLFNQLNLAITCHTLSDSLRILREYDENGLYLFLSALRSSNADQIEISKESLKGIVILFEIHGLLTREEKELSVQNISDLLLNQEHSISR